jgi:hypothetical protein
MRGILYVCVGCPSDPSSESLTIFDYVCYVQFVGLFHFGTNRSTVSLTLYEATLKGYTLFQNS